MGGIVCGVVIRFATLENIDYVFNMDWGGVVTSQDVAFYRSFSAIPLHGLCGVIVNFNFGKYVFTSDTNISVFITSTYFGSWFL